MNFELASLIVETLIGLGWIAVIYYGIYRYENLNNKICAAMEQRLQRYPEHAEGPRDEPS